MVKKRPSRLALLKLVSSNVETSSGNEEMMTVQYRYYSRVAMTQSIMRPNYPWSIFAAEELLADAMISKQSGNWDDLWKTKYFYLCSSNKLAKVFIYETNLFNTNRMFLYNLNESIFIINVVFYIN